RVKSLMLRPSSSPSPVDQKPKDFAPTNAAELIFASSVAIGVICAIASRSEGQVAHAAAELLAFASRPEAEGLRADERRGAHLRELGGDRRDLRDRVQI